MYKFKKQIFYKIIADNKVTEVEGFKLQNGTILFKNPKDGEWTICGRMPLYISKLFKDKKSALKYLRTELKEKILIYNKNITLLKDAIRKERNKSWKNELVRWNEYNVDASKRLKRQLSIVVKQLQ